eukprot:4024238-Pleurochrysis_carterae.AAC.1
MDPGGSPQLRGICATPIPMMMASMTPDGDGSGEQGARRDICRPLFGRRYLTALDVQRKIFSFLL